MGNPQPHMQHQRLKIAGESPEAELRLEELQAMRARTGEAGEGALCGLAGQEHDDLSPAPALARWRPTLQHG